MILVKKPKLDYDQEENDNLRKEEDEENDIEIVKVH